MHDVQQVLVVAEQAARAAGAVMKEHSGRPEKIDAKSHPRDLVTEVDRRCERLISETIASSFPEDFILGEETVAGHGGTGAVLNAGHEHLWVVDPLDGTTNFISDIPFYCVSIAYAYRGILQAGVVYHPHLDELFVAVRGRGAFLNGRAIRVSATASLSESILATGFPSGEQARDINTRGLMRLIPLCRNVRTMGSAALHLAYVACGRLTGFWETHLNPWDLAAGALLVEEAGGRVTDTIGRPYHLPVSHVAASNGRIHQELLTQLRQANGTAM
ncbi:MAG: inositol monophosphatase [Alicyclobacillaceae bacterium]|nr:inositol monophosphatase [Alicyclobacillaceae bacterium]